jgi:RNA polymerase sigma factor (TIGR02999 family)
MRRILVDRARRRAAGKRGGRPQPLDLTKAVDVTQAKARELVALDDALGALAALDPQLSRMVELRFFAGLSVKEIAAVLQVSSDTVMREWKVARAWLLSELSERP